MLPEKNAKASLCVLTERFATEKSSTDGIILDEETGLVWKNGENLGRLKKGGQKFQFFKALRLQQGKAIQHSELASQIKSRDSRLKP